MNKKIVLSAALLMGGAAAAQAWDLADVRKDNKQIIVPFHQQSGWYYPDQPAEAAPREKKQDTFAELESNLTDVKHQRDLF